MPTEVLKEKKLNSFEEDYAKYEGLTVAEEAEEAAPIEAEAPKETPKEPVVEEVKKPEEEAPKEVKKPDEAKPVVDVEEKRSPSLTDKQYLEEVRKKREELRPKIMESYKIKDEDIEAFASGDHDAIRKVLTGLTADVYLDSFEANQMINRAQLPGMVKSIQAQAVEEKSSTKSFFDKWPELKEEKHQEAVRKIVGTYRTMNPKATQEEVISSTGAIAMQALGLQRGVQQEQKEEKATSHQPANPGATGGAVNPPVSQNPYTRDYEVFKDIY